MIRIVITVVAQSLKYHKNTCVTPRLRPQMTTSQRAHLLCFCHKRGIRTGNYVYLVIEFILLMLHWMKLEFVRVRNLADGISKQTVDGVPHLSLLIIDNVRGERKIKEKSIDQ